MNIEEILSQSSELYLEYLRKNAYYENVKNDFNKMIDTGSGEDWHSGTAQDHFDRYTRLKNINDEVDMLLRQLKGLNNDLVPFMAATKKAILYQYFDRQTHVKAALRFTVNKGQVIIEVVK